MSVTQKAAGGPAKAMPYTDVWWHRPWVIATEGVLWHIVAVIVGFVMMVLLPVGIIIGLLGVAMFLGGLFAHITRRA